MIIWSFYTIGTPYEHEALKLVDSIEANCLDHFILVPVIDLGDWQLNVKQRPSLILRAMEMVNDSILAVDCDATFERDIDIDFDNLDCDIAAHIMDKAFWKQDISKRKYSLMAGTLYFPNTVRAKEILTRWDVACQKTKDWDQRVLEKIVKEYKLFELPVEYCVIDKTMWGIDNPIIRHHQVSRKLRRIINAC